MAVTVTFVKFSLSFILSSQPLLFLMPFAVSNMIMLTMECDIVWYLQNGPLVCFETLKPHFPMQMVSH